MGRRRAGRTSWPTLEIPEPLLDALATLHGPLTDRKAIKRIAKGLEQLHEGLTRDRARFAGRPYLADPMMRLAYSTYVVCAQAPKLSPVLDRWMKYAPGGSSNTPADRLKVLELGCGPGTGVAGMWAWAQPRGIRWRHYATDAVPEALSAAEALGRALGVRDLSTRRVDLRSPLGPQLEGVPPVDITLMMNVVNELPTRLFSTLAESLASTLAQNGALVVIDPAAFEPSRRALTFRDALSEAGWTIRAPCPQSGPCPALAADGEWCHENWTLARPSFMAAVDALVGTRRETLKATWFIADRHPSTSAAEPGLARVVSERFEERGRSRARVCTPEGLVTLELQRRDRGPTNRDFAQMGRFSLIRYTGGTPVGDALRLGAEDTVSVIQEADEPD